MIIGGKEVEQIIITTTDGEVLAVISNAEIIEKRGIRVSLISKEEHEGQNE